MGMPMTEGMGMLVAFIMGTKNHNGLDHGHAYGYSHGHVNYYTPGVTMTFSTGILGILNVVNRESIANRIQQWYNIIPLSDQL